MILLTIRDVKNNNFINELMDAGLPEPLIDTIVCVGQLVNIKRQTKLIEAMRPVNNG